MPLTKRQRALFKEAESIAEWTNLDFYSIEDVDHDFRIIAVRIAIDKMVIAEVVTRYTLLDEILSDLICRYFFKVKPFNKLWRTKKFRTFVHYILDEMYPLKKMEVVNAIKSLPHNVRTTIYDVNKLRNALAHSFFPENRKEYRKHKKVLYNGKDIRTSDGLKTFSEDCRTTWDYLARRAWGALPDE